MIDGLGPPKLPAGEVPFSERVLSEGSSVLKATLYGALILRQLAATDPAQALAPDEKRLLDGLIARAAPGSRDFFAQRTEWLQSLLQGVDTLSFASKLEIPITVGQLRTLERTAECSFELYSPARREDLRRLSATLFGSDASTERVEPYPLPEPAPVLTRVKG